MKAIFKSALAVVAILAASNVYADDYGRLYIIGTSTPGNWELDDAQSLLSTTENPSVYSGTLYLKGGTDNTFKFMENHEWGSTEYGLPAGVESTIVDGEFRLATGTLDDGYKQLSVAADGNYHIVVDTKNLEASVTLSGYQESEIKYCALYLVGNATDGGWTVDKATPLYQNVNIPYQYSAVVALKATDNGDPASFKIAKALRGAGSWNAAYYYFRDSNDSGKISTDSTDDRQWRVDEDGDYAVTVNTHDNTISIEKANGSTTGIDAVTSAVTPDEVTVYYDLYGRKVANPAAGIFIEVRGKEVRKVIIK